MNRDEKNLQTRRKIMDNALRQFGENNYGDASLNTVCASGNISKGIIYHYFKDKDELYLLCVQECFDELTKYLDSVASAGSLPIDEALERYFDARIAFFGEHPLYLGVFCGAIMSPPAHLSAAIDEISAELNSQAISLLTALLKPVKLRDDITLQDVIEVFREYQDFVNARFQLKSAGDRTLGKHEARCRRSLQILLYGVIERGV